MREEERDVQKVERAYHANEIAFTHPKKPLVVVQPTKPTGLWQKEVERRKKKAEGVKAEAAIPPANIVPANGAAGPPRVSPVFPPLCLTHTAESVTGKCPANLKSSIESVDVSFGKPFSTGFRTGNKIVDAMVSGYGDSSARMPDPFTCVPTFPVNCHYSATFTPTFPATGTTTYGGFAMLLMGSGVGTFKMCTLTGAVSTVGVDWSTGTIYDVGINSSNFVSRPIGINSNLTYTSVGPLHPITVTAFPILPDTLSTIAAAPTGWPNHIAAGLTTVQSVWGGRQWQVNPGESVNFITAPLDNRSFDFELSTAARSRYDALGQLAWSGWAIWIWGMTAGDSMGVRTTVGEECAYTNATSTVYNYPQSRVAADPAVSSHAKDTFSNLMERGYGAVKYAAEHVAPVISKAWDLVGKIGSLGANADTNYTGYLSAAAPVLMYSNRPASAEKLKAIGTLPVQRTRSVPVSEEKVDDVDEQVIVTPLKARRPSVAQSLTGRVR